jgi:glutamine synthetase
MGDISLLESFLATHPSIKYIRYQWVDYSGILRIRILPIAHARRLAEFSTPVAIPPVAMTAVTLYGYLPEYPVTGLDHLHPDLSSLRPCYYAPGHASVMCFISEGIHNVGFERCPRTILKRTCERAREMGVHFKVGFEMEFRTFKPDGPIVEECIEGFNSAAGLRNACYPILAQVVEMLETAGIEVYQFHAGDAAGMFEMITGPLSPLEAVDAWIYTRECIKTLFARNDIIATMHPSPTFEHHGVGTRFHISMDPPTQATSDPFLAGMLANLPALCALSMPLEASYHRVNDYKSEAGEYGAWGTLHRQVPINKIENGRWEVRCADGAANLYLAVAAFLGSGLQGINKGLTLESEDFAREYQVGATELEKEGKVRRLPKSLVESLEAFGEVGWRGIGMGAAATAYEKIRRFDMESLKKLSEKERVHLLTRHF